MKNVKFIVTVYDESNRLIGVSPWYTNEIGLSITTQKQIEYLGTPETSSDYLDVFVKKGLEKDVAYYLVIDPVLAPVLRVLHGLRHLLQADLKRATVSQVLVIKMP